MISLNAGDEKELVFKNHKAPELTIYKEDSIAGAPIEGARFHVTYTSTGEAADAPESIDFGEIDLNTTMMYRHEDYVDAIRFVREGMVQLQPLMSRHFAFTDYLAAYEYIDTHQETTMKVLIDVDPSDD